MPAVRPSLGLLVVLAACGDDPPPPAPPPVVVPPPPPAVIAPQPIATPGAFDLVAFGGGAVLFVGAPGRLGGDVSSFSLDGIGRLRANGERRIAARHGEGIASDALEISAAGGGGRLAVAWVERADRRLLTRAAFGGGEGPFSPPVELGPSAGENPLLRGRIGVAGAPDGTLAVLYRSEAVPCTAGDLDKSCASFRFERIGAGEGVEVRRTDGLVVPTPCATPIVRYAHVAGAWYYGLCAEDGAHTPITTVYALQFEPEYAHAEPVLAGCDALRMGPSTDGVVLACESEPTRAIELREAGRGRRELARGPAAPVCRDGRPVLALDELELALSEARSGLEAWLPAEVAPARARAVWTGESLLVAAPTGGEVLLWRYACEEGRFSRSS